LFLPTAPTRAQIPNSGFETWSSGTPNGWSVNNVPGLDTTISRSATAHGGSFAVRGDVVSFSTVVVQPILQSGSNAEGFPYTQRPLAFTGYYEFQPAASFGDKFAINVILFKGGVSGTIVGVAAAGLSASVSAYTQFIVPFVYQTSDNPDTCVVEIQIVGPDTGQHATPHVGSYFLLDDIGFSGVTNVADRQTLPKMFRLDQNYPNPFNPTTNISFSFPADGKATLRVFNVLGQEVASLFDGTIQAGKLYRITFNGTNLSSGVYFARLDFGDKYLMRKMTLLK
jgi:hypothetical protein